MDLKEMMDLRKVINELIDHFDDAHWEIIGFSSHPYLNKFKKQTTEMEALPVEYVKQCSPSEQMYHGTIFFPTEYNNGDGKLLFMQVDFYEK